MIRSTAAGRIGGTLNQLGFRPACILDSQGFILTITAETESAGLMGAWKRYSWLKAHKAQLDIEFGKRLLWVDHLLTVQVHRQWPEHAPSKGIGSSADEALALLARLEKAIGALSPSASATQTQPQTATPVPIQVQLPTRHPTPTKDPPF